MKRVCLLVLLLFLAWGVSVQNPTVTTPRISERVTPVVPGTSLPCNVDASPWCVQTKSQGAGTLTIPVPGGTPTPTSGAGGIADSIGAVWNEIASH
jgi:hypothetical protein